MIVISFSEPDNPKKVIVKKLVLVAADRPEISLDLTGDLSQLKKETFIIKEGVSYRIRIEFIVQREIVHGLKYVQKTSKLGIPGKRVRFYIIKMFINRGLYYFS